MVSAPNLLTDSDSPSTGVCSFQAARWRTVCLVLLLLLGQAALLHHIVQHGLDQAIGQQDKDGGCSFCATGGHTITPKLPSQPVPSLILVWVLCFLPAAQYIITRSPQTLEARAPPLLSVA